MDIEQEKVLVKAAQEVRIVVQGVSVVITKLTAKEFLFEQKNSKWLIDRMIDGRLYLVHPEISPVVS